MSTIVTRSGKGSPLTNTEVDANFTNLNTGKAELSGATFTGTVTANAGVVVDNITIDGNEIDVGSGNLTLDIAADFIVDAESDIFLDAASGIYSFNKAGSQGFTFTNSSGDITLKTFTSDKDFIVQGVDGGSTITALTLDMSAAGAATFSSTVTSTGMTIGTSDATSKRLIFQGSGGAGYEGGINWQRDNAIDNSITVDSTESLSINYAQSDLSGRALLFKSGSAGTERMRIDSSGNVGIGTSSFTSASAGRTVLEVNGASASALINLSVNGTRQGYIFTDTTDMNVYNVDNGSLNFGTNNAERMRIDSSGNVGIGGTPNSYSGQTTLTINSTGVARLDLDIGNANQGYLLAENGYIGLYAASGKYVSMGVAGSGEAIRIDSSGNVIVGGSNDTGFAATKLKTGSYSTAESGINILTTPTGTGYLLFGDGTGAASYSGGIHYNHNTSSMSFRTLANNERMTIDSLGYIQMGATLATHIGTSQLFVNRGVNAAAATSGTTQTGGALRLRGGDNAVLDMGMNSVNTWIQATDRANLANGYPLSLNPNGGNVGIGTNAPASPLHVTTSSTGLAGDFTNTNTSGYGLRVTTYGTGAQYGFAVDSNGGGYSRDFTVGADGNVNVLTGNLVIGTAGKGIDFSATAGSGTSELLDDYEEGTWTASLSGVASQTLGNNVGYYTKIGHRVFFQWYSSSSTIGTANGLAYINGLPFTSSSAGASYGLFHYVHGNGVLNSTGGYVNINATNMVFISENSVSGSNFSAGSGKYIMIQGSYSVA
jgi:hypothetical protein